LAATNRALADASAKGTEVLRSPTD
jgi:hypothetical protein